MKKMMILFTGYNQRAIVAFLRTLEANGTPYAIVASSKKDPIFLTGYKRNVVATREQAGLDLADMMNSIGRVQDKFDYDKYVIAPSTEALNRFLLENKSEFEELGCEIPLANRDLYENVSDKYKFSKLCRKNNIMVPAEYKGIDNVKLPCVAKPRKYFTRSGATHSPVLIHSLKELKEFREDYNPRDFYFQEFIGGESLYLLYYFYGDGTYTKCSQVNVIQQPKGKSIVAAEYSNFHNTAESSKYEKLFSLAGFSGLVMVEVKRLKRKSYMIEANPRFWGPSQLFVDAGINLFEDFLSDNGLLDHRPKAEPINKKAKYFWYGGVIDALNSGRKLVYHDIKKETFIKEMPKWLSSDVYNRQDTEEIFKQEVNMTPEDKLIELYSNRSKHSNYQVLPTQLKKILNDKDVQTRTRSEAERLKYILEKTDVKGKSVLDIGANTGFFSFELLGLGAKSVHYYEGNATHAEFVRLAARVTGQEKKIKITNGYFSFDGQHSKHYDMILLLNVLHHVGDDYGDDNNTVAGAKEAIIEQLNSLSTCTDIMVFQIGFNWKGDPAKPIFKNGTKQEMIDYVRANVKDTWNIKAIGIAEQTGKSIRYRDLSKDNVARDDSLGEFLNRPLFILRSKGGHGV